MSARSHDTETLCGHLKLSDIDEVSQGQGLVIMVNRWFDCQDPEEDEGGWWLFG